MEKINATEIQATDIIDFDAKTGYHCFYEQPDDFPSSERFSDENRAQGRLYVISVEKVMGQDHSYSSGRMRRFATEYKITFADGRSIRVRGNTKFPIMRRWNP